MNFILFLLLIPLSFADDRFCTEVGGILSHYEKKLGKSSIANCSSVKVEELLQGHPGLEGLTYLQDKKCQSLTSLETELERLKAELSVANGIEKLKTQISESQKEAGQGNRMAGMTFVSGLRTAQSLEVLLETDTFDNKPFAQKIKEIPADKRKSEADFVAIMKDLCKDKASDDVNACNPKLFKPNKEAIHEILGLIDSVEVNQDQVEKWKGMLAIEKANAEAENARWSFTEIQNELGSTFNSLDNNKILTREEINAIKKLDHFKNARGFSFVEDIAGIKDQKKLKIHSDKVFLLIGDARTRSQYEVQSKLSVAWGNHKHLFQNLSEAEASSCEKAKLSYDEAKLCHAALLKNSKDISSGDLKENILPGIGASITFTDKLQATENRCRPELEQKGVMPESCLAELPRETGEIQQKIRQLNILKDKIGSENQKEMVYRNFALKKWADKCSTVETSMDQCDLTDDFTISKNALMAVKDTLDVAVVFTPKPEAEEKMEELCDDDDTKKIPSLNGKLCSYLEKTPVVIETKNAPAEKEYAVIAPDGGHERDANRDRYIQASQNLLTDVIGSFMNQQYGQQTNPPINPYPYNYTPFNAGMPPMGIADSIMFNARYYGAYGFYMPTPGYTPYTAFGSASPISAYKPLNTGNYQYFGQ